MIKFFRNIRKTLLNEGKTTIYLKYAIGEIVLVVIGILIALMINNWNNQVNQNNKEINWLYNLKSDLEYDKRFLNEQLDYLKESADVIRGVISMIDDQSQQIKDTISFLRQLKRITMTFYFKPTNTTYLQMTGTGEMSTVSRRNIMRSIIEYHQSALLTYELNEIIKEVKWYRYNDILEQVIDPLIMAAMTEDVFYQLEQWPQNEKDSNLLENKLVSLDRIRGNIEFRTVLGRSLDMTIVQRGDIYRCLENCINLLNMFEQELED